MSSLNQVKLNFDGFLVESSSLSVVFNASSSNASTFLVESSSISVIFNESSSNVLVSQV